MNHNWFFSNKILKLYRDNIISGIACLDKNCQNQLNICDRYNS
ncbi:MAG: hypothetical protein AAF378_21970 [Cyanobacteria bacterium P01_A01_bin.84]